MLASHRRRLRKIERLESRNLLASVVMHSFAANGATQLALTYEVLEPTSSVEIGFYRSSDNRFGTDIALDSLSLTAAADLAVGIHTKALAIGGAADQIALPGAGAPEVAEDYYLLAVANPSETESDNTAVFSGVYHPAGGGVYIHGQDTADSIVIDSNHRVNFNSSLYTYVASDVTAFRVRAHAGDDSVNGSTAVKTISIYAAEGDDVLTGGTLADTLRGGPGSDRLIGGRGNDSLDGGQDSDVYIVIGTGSGTDVLLDSGTLGNDRLEAGAINTTIVLGTRWSMATTGLESITSAGFSGLQLVGSTGIDNLSLAGQTVSGVSIIDGYAGADQFVGSDGDDAIRGAAGDDVIDGGLGTDTAHFAGASTSYEITPIGGTWQIRDLAPTVNGNDGTDRLVNVEWLRFLDKVVSLSTLTNRPPVAQADEATVSEDAAPVVIPVLNNDTDADLSDTKRVIAVSSPGTRGIVQVATNGAGVLFYTNQRYESLRADEVITETILYTMADAAGAASTATLLVTVTGRNDAPVAVSDTNLTVSENAAPISITVLANDTDVDSGDLRSVVSTDGSGVPDTVELVIIYGVGAPILVPGVPAIRGSVSVAADNQSINYSVGNGWQSLLAGQTAIERFRYTMRDAVGATSTTWVTVSVQGANDAPLANPDSLTVGKNAAPITMSVLTNDSDPDLGDSKTIVSLDTTGLLGTAALSADGKSIIYSVGSAFETLLPTQTAIETLRYTMADSAGATSTAVVSITISGANQVPVAVADAAVVQENGAPLIIDVLANDIDPDLGDAKNVVAIDTTGIQGTVAIAPGGSGVIYSVGNAFQNLSSGATASEVFRYTVRDSAGAQSTAAVTVTIVGQNDRPVATSNSAAALEDGPSIFIDVLANDIDVDNGDTLTVLAVSGQSIAGTPLQGTVSIAPGGTGINYAVGSAFQQLRAGATATEIFTYTIVDGSGISATASVTVTITGVNDQPLAIDNSVSISEDVASTSITVLTNDTDPDNGDTKRILSINTTGLRGSATLATNGTTVNYSPGNAFQYLVSGQTAVESFAYTMVDGAGAQSTATVTVTVNGVTDGPKAMPDSALAAEDAGPIVIPILDNDFHDLNPSETLTISQLDGAGSPATLELILIYGVGVGFFNPGFPATKGSIAIGPDGRSVIYTPYQSLSAGQSENDLFRYTIRDTSGRTSTAIVAVTVSGANDAPVANPDQRNVSIDAAPTFLDVLANDSDPDSNDTKRVIGLDASTASGTATIAPNGAGIIYSVGAAHQGLLFGQSAQETIVYTMVDSAGLQSQATATVTVTGINHAPIANGDFATATEDGSAITIDVLANDQDQDIVQGDTQTILSVNPNGLLGTVSVAADGKSLTYAVGTAFQHLKVGATATESFSYTIRDGQGLTASANVTVTIQGTNDAPVAVANAYSISEDAAPTTLTVLTDDIDVDVADSKTIVEVGSAGLQGSVSIGADGTTLVYTVGASFQALNSGQTATERLTYTLADGQGARSTASVTITILGANEPVVIVNPPPPPVGAIVGTANDDVLITANAADVIYGQAGDDTITANGGDDTIFGGVGRDQIDGGAGNDIINGGADRDDLTGGAGADTFKYYLASESTATALDRIRDFDASQGDKIDISLIDANTLVGGNNDFVVSASLTGIAGQLVIVTISAGVYQIRGDVNGDGVADLQIEVKAKSPLTAADLLL